ncbi:TetR family transcriptional regulator [Achromobacter denitrificans]|uniref:TetR family transcriptional regulator n=1 Tax=Achromobacter denitrificans TaxID=32002 RepID=UPI00242AD880|nr:TetR family transcriptional regulator [Achromobacter denitrificans]MBV2159268.1 TetR family transcriptional regulator [Achromobacter denitrificans]
MDKSDAAPIAIRRRILDAAAQTQSVRRTALGDVARLAGLARGTIHPHCADKDALIQAVRKELAREQGLAHPRAARRECR